MSPRRKMKSRYRRFSQLTDMGGIKSAIGEMRGLGYPKQPRLNRDDAVRGNDSGFDEQWFVDTIKELGPNPLGTNGRQ